MRTSQTYNGMPMTKTQVRKLMADARRESLLGQHCIKYGYLEGAIGANNKAIAALYDANVLLRYLENTKNN